MLADFYPRPPYGGRPARLWRLETKGDFYPRPPYGGRPKSLPSARRFGYFYPRPPYGGRPWALAKAINKAEISIHVPRMGDDANQQAVFGQS